MHTDSVFDWRTGPILVPAAHQRYIECHQKQSKTLSTRTRYYGHTERRFLAKLLQGRPDRLDVKILQLNLTVTEGHRRDDPNLSEPRNILPTVIHNLATIFLPFRSFVAERLRKDPDLTRELEVGGCIRVPRVWGAGDVVAFEL